MTEREIFILALQQEDPAKRQAYLDAVCAGQPELRKQVDGLLQLYEGAGSFLEKPAAESAATGAFAQTVEQASPLEMPGVLIGPYKLIEEIGEGGMGTVWMAQQTEPVKRLVAIKLIKAGMDSRQIIARFEAERQALALMDHANIARVLDAGTTKVGRPYFVMDLVKGVPITRYCDEHHLTPRERLELFIPVCHAVQHAHQKGIIHRDLKPSNVLVALYDGYPVPKVIDFGVAKAAGQTLTEKTLVTGFGAIVGTLEYMSPEQAERNQLDIDTRSDIYSLGVLLYELLTGSPPFSKRDLEKVGMLEMLRVIREQEPSKPSTKLSSSDALPSLSANRGTEPAKLTKLVRGELDWIVMKALEKDRNRRYETANGFAMDVQRYLNDEHVQACPPSAAYRLSKFTRRNRAALATSAVVLAALVIGTTVSTWQAIRATNALQAEERARHEAEIARDGEAKQRKRAQDNAAEAEGQRQRAEDNFGKARRAVDEYLSQITENELLSVPGLQPLREDLLQAALKFYSEFTQDRADDQTLLQDLASAQHRLAKIQNELGNAAASKTANAEAIRLYEQLRQQQATVDVQAGLANAYFFAGRYGDTIKICQSILEVDSGKPEVRSLLAETYNQLANADYLKNNFKSALKYHQQAFELREALVRDFPDDPSYLAQLGSTVNNLGVLLSKQDKHDQALAMYERAVHYWTQGYERAPHSIIGGRWLCIGLGNVAGNQNSLGRQEEALRTYERLVAVSRKRAFDNPAIGALRGDLYRAYLLLGNHQKQLGESAEASRNFRLAREVLEQIPRETPDQLFELATVYAALASPLQESAEPSEDEAAEQGRNAELAMETLKKATDAGFQNASWLETSKPLDSLRGREDFQALLATVQKLAEADRLAKTNVTDKATRLANSQRAAELLKGLNSSPAGETRHRMTLAATLQSVGVLQTGLKQFEEAEKTLNDALKLRGELLKEMADRPQARVDELTTRAAIGQLYWESDRPQDAHQLWQDVLKQCRQLATKHSDDQALQSGIAAVERSIGQRYGEIGLWPLVAPLLETSLQSGQLYDSAWDVRSAAVLAAQGRLDEHGELFPLIADKWGKTIPAQTVWAAAMNPQPVLEVNKLLEHAEVVLKSQLEPLWKFKAATAWSQAGDPQKALELMLQASNEAVAGDPACLYWLAMVNHRLDQKQQAARYFQQAEALYERAAQKCLGGTGKSAVKDATGGTWTTWAEAQAARRLAWKELRGTADLDDPWQRLIQARAFQLLGEQSNSDAELAASEKAWQRFLELAGDDARPWIQRGHWYVERGQLQKADADFAKAATLTPDELNKFLEAGWWASTTPEGISPLLSQQLVDLPASRAEATAPVSPTVVATEPHGQLVLFRNVPEFKDAETAYAVTYVYAPEAKAVTLHVGGNNAAELRLNGRLVYQWKTSLSAYNAVRVPVLLRPGRNTLVARVSNPGQSHSFILRIGDNRLDRGLELAQFGFWKEALELLKPELADGQRLDPHVWFLYSVLLPLRGDSNSYREFYDQVLNWIGNNPAWSTKMHVSQVCALAPVPQTDMARLVQLVDEGVAGAKGANWAVDMQSRVYFRAGRYQQVLDRVRPGDLRRSTLRALCWHHLGQANKAKLELQVAERDLIDKVRMGPEGPSSARVSSFGHGLLDIVADYILLREARELIAPDTSPDDRALQALIAQTRQQVEAADPQLLPFEMALISGSKNPQRWLDRGRARAVLAQPELAQADFDKAIEIAPDDPEVLASRSLIYAELDRADEAIADLTRLLDEPRDSTKAPAWLAARQRLFDELGQWPELFERMTQLRPADPNPWIGRARYRLATQPDQAIADLQEAVARGYRDLDQLQTDARWQALKSRDDFQTIVRAIEERNQEELLMVAKLEGHTGLVRGVAFLPDGERLVSIGADKLVNVWDLETRSVLSSFPVAMPGWLREAAVSKDGRRFATLSNDGEMKGFAQVWDLEKQQRLGEFVQDFKLAHSVRFSPSGTHILTGGAPPRGVLWDLSTGKEQQRFSFEDTFDGHAGAFSPDGRMLALSTVGRVHLFDVTSSAPLSTIRLTNNRFVAELVFSASGARLVIGQNGGHLSLIDVDSRQVLKTLKASESNVSGLKFLGGDRFVLATNTDGTVRIWDVQQEGVINTAAAKAGSTSELAVSPNGRFAVTAGGQEWDEASKQWKGTGDYALRLWQLPKNVWPNKETSESEPD